jgi:hypothetical protein
MDLRPAAETAVCQCTSLTPDEACVIVTDDERARIGESLVSIEALSE